MNFFKRRAILKKANFLELVPIKLVKEEIEANIVTLLLPKFTSSFAKKHIVPKLTAPLIKLKLDELGSASWIAIDGEKNVESIINELQSQYGDKIQEIDDRFTKFLSLLYEQKLITFDIIHGK